MERLGVEWWPKTMFPTLTLRGSLFVTLTATLSLSAICQQSPASPPQPNVAAPQSKGSRPVPKLGSLGASCQDLNIDKYGEITFFARHEGFAYGISTPKVKLGEHEELHVYLWLSNESNRALELYVCCGIPLLNEIQIVDSSGKRLVSGWEMHHQKTKAAAEVCNCSWGVIAQPGSCRLIDSGVLNSLSNAYSMPPGAYAIMEDPQPPHPLPEAPVYPPRPAKDQQLVVTITAESATAAGK